MYPSGDLLTRVSSFPSQKTSRRMTFRCGVMYFSFLHFHIMQKTNMRCALFCITVFGMELAVDFTAPALLAFLSLMLPKRTFLHMCAACLLHEAAHFFAMIVLRRRPSLLRVSAAGLHLELKQDAVCPLPVLAAVLLAGAAANFSAATLFFALHMPDAVQAHASLAVFNLLPYRSTDGGTLLCAVLEPRLIRSNPAKLRSVMRTLCILLTASLSALLIAAHSRNLSVWCMILFMTAAEWLSV